MHLEKNWFSAVYLHQWTGQRFATSDNLDVLDGFGTGNLLLQCVLKTAKPQNATVNIDFRLENIWNAPYQIIAYRPMPGRSFRAGLTLSW